jgi:hypothetical protein
MRFARSMGDNLVAVAPPGATKDIVPWHASATRRSLVSQFVPAQLGIVELR